MPIALAFAAALAGCSGAAFAPPAGSTNVLPDPARSGTVGTRSLAQPLAYRASATMAGRALALCPPSTDPARAACLLRFVAFGTQGASTATAGFTPADLASIYGLGGSFLQTQWQPVVGIVVAYDYAGAESDVATYRAHFGLPACSSANGCFRRVGAAAAVTVFDSQGLPTSVSAHPTGSSSGWAAEADADIEVVSGVCRSCRIVVAEAASDSLADLAVAVRAAVAAGAVVVNASFGAPEAASQSALEPAFEPAPVKVVAAAGDAGRQALFPAAATNVIAVAGTSVSVAGLIVTERLWSESGGGCSAIFVRAAYQPAVCGSKRSIADVAVVADPNDGIAIYDSGVGGWGMVGGTSVAAPIVASMLALSGNAGSGAGSQTLYAHALFHYAPVSGGGAIAGNGAPLGVAAL